MTNEQVNGSTTDGQGNGSVNQSIVTAIHPKVLEAVGKMIAEAKARDMAIGIQSGVRSAAEQDALYAKGRTEPGNIVTNAKAYESWHCLGLAVDITPRNDHGSFWWPDDSSKWADLGAVGKMFGLEWGGDWKNFPDRPHFQMRPKINGKAIDVHQAKFILFRDGLDRLWGMV